MGKEGEKESRERKLPFPSFWVFIPWQKSVPIRKKSSAIRGVALCAQDGQWGAGGDDCCAEPRVVAEAG